MLNGTKISRLRRLLGLSQADLAAIVGTSQPFISEIERGIKPVPEERAARLEQALDLTEATRKILNSGEWR
jgi:transcriptional regulator with XRE-family HTH domain